MCTNLAIVRGPHFAGIWDVGDFLFPKMGMNLMGNHIYGLTNQHIFLRLYDTK